VRVRSPILSLLNYHSRRCVIPVMLSVAHSGFLSTTLADGFCRRVNLCNTIGASHLRCLRTALERNYRYILGKVNKYGPPVPDRGGDGLLC
jgi:hypothetical protein